MHRHRRPARLAALLLPALIVAGCVAVAPALDYPVASAEAYQAEAAFQREAMLKRLQDHDRRLAGVVFRLQRANVDLCPRRGPLTGWVLHHSAQYDAATRDGVARLYGLDAYPGVLAIAPGSPAGLADLREGDRLVAVNGRELAVAPPPGGVSYAPIAQATRLLGEDLAKGPARLSLLRGVTPVEITLRPVPGCDYPVQLLTSDELNAWADGRRVSITTAMVRYALTDDELAIFVAHELAHNILGHQQRIAASGPAGAVFGNVGTPPGNLIALEREADYLGLYLAVRAGFDLTSAPELWRRFGADYPQARYARWSHPGALERAVNLGAALREIQAKQAAGQPLLPNPAAVPP